MDVVSQVLSVRSRDVGGLEKMVGASVLAHIALLAAVTIVPSSWLGVHEAEPEVVMSISLAGVEGPRTGMTMLSARPIQTQATETTKTIEPVRPPAAQAPEMIEQKKAAPKKSETPVEKAATDAKSRTPTKGAETRTGTAKAETPARGLGFGLSTGGIPAEGSYLDTANFCCTEYLGTMSDLIKKNWDYRQQASGITVMRFTIERSGQLTNIQIDKSSGYPALDLLAQRALLYTRQLPPLPTAFTESSLTVHLVFEYQR